MTARRCALALLIVAAAIAGAPARARAAGLDPFRPSGSKTTVSLDPFRVAQAQAAPASTPAPAAPPPATPATQAAAAPKACHVDEDCPAENICQNQVCQAIQTSTNILYLYYREGTFTEVLGLYWARRGATGYTVLAPFWWHFWSPQSQTRIFAPFFWKFEDYAKQGTLTVIVPGLPISWSSEPGAKSFGVWPLFYASTKFGWAAPLLGTFRIGDPDKGTTLGAAAFLYWWRRTPDNKFDLVLPVAISSRSRDHSLTYAVPLNFIWSNRDDKNVLVLPLLYANTHKTGSSFYTLFGYSKREKGAYKGSAFWLYWFAGDDKGREGYNVLFPIVWDFHAPASRTSVVFPLFWYFRTGEDRTTIGFPLVWSFRSPASSTTVVGPWVHLRRGDWTFDTLFPVWWSASDKDSSFRTLLPLFFWKQSTNGKKLTWLILLGGYYRDDEEHSKTLLLFPLFYRKDPQREVRVFTPLYIRHESYEDYSTTRLLGLLFYQRTDGQGSTTAFFPLFWRFRDEPSGATATALLPFFGRRSGPRDTTTFAGLGLWLYWRSFAGGGWSAGVFPLAFFGRNGGRSHDVVFPLYWHFGHDDASSTVLLPIFYRHHDRRGSATGILPLLTFVGERDGESYAIQFPLFWRFTNAHQGWSTTVTPLGFGHRDADGWSMGLGPLIPIFYLRSGEKRSHAVLFPLYWHFRDGPAQKTTDVLGPYMHRTWGGETTDALFPVFYYSRGARPGSAPATTASVFPLFYYRRSAEQTTVVTLVGVAKTTPKGSSGFIGPFIWHRDPDLTMRLVPFLYADVQRASTGEHTRQIGPWYALDAPGKKSRVLFPLWGRYQDDKETDTYVFPTYFRQRRSDGGKIDSLLPLYWHSEGAGKTFTLIGLYYDRTSPGVHSAGLAPLVFYGRNPERTYTFIPPLLFLRWRGQDKQGDHERIWCALFWHTRDNEESTSVLFPVWWSRKSPGRNVQIVFPLLWHEADTRPGSAKERTLVGPFYWSSYGTTKTRGLLPIAWMTRDSAEGKGTTALMPLFYESHARDRALLYTVLAGYNRQPTGKLWYFWPALFSDQVDSKFSMVFPFWFSSTNKATETTTTVIPPLLALSHTTPETSTTTFLLLFWHHRDIASSTTLGLPLFLDSHDYHVSRTTIVLPFLVRYRRDSDQNVYTVAPLFYRHWTPTEVTTVGFPLLWDFKRGNDRTTIFFPFYAHWRRPGYASTYIFPTLYFRTGLTPDGREDGTWRYVVAPFYDAAVKRPGDFMWEVLGGLFGHERIGRNRYLKILFMTFETQPAPRAQTSWYSKPLPVSRRAPPHTLSMNRW